MKWRHDIYLWKGDDKISICLLFVYEFGVRACDLV